MKADTITLRLSISTVGQDAQRFHWSKENPTENYLYGNGRDIPITQDVRNLIEERSKSQNIGEGLV